MRCDRHSLAAFGLASILSWWSAACGGPAEQPRRSVIPEGGSSVSSDAGVDQRAEAGSSLTGACSMAPPVPGDTCSNATVVCTYGDSPRPECHQAWTCPSGVWLAGPTCVPPAEGFCPTLQPTDGDPCSVADASDHVNCVYSDTTLCACECAAVLGGGCTPTQFRCHTAPATSGCPPTIPNIGEPCLVQGTQCVYGNPCNNGLGAAILCRSGVWAAGFYNCYD